MITVLTSTYNRAYTLERLYQSLCSQEDKDFVWLVVDDGSSDESVRLIDKFRAENKIRIEYIHQENGGKHRSLNRGSEAIKEGWILIVDSDDALTTDAIKSVKQTIKKHDKENISAVCFRRAYFKGGLIGAEIKDEIMQIHPTVAGRLFRGDLVYVFRRDLMAKYPFPTFDKEKFVPELYIFNKIADELPIIYFPQKAIYLCEYLSDGYTHNFKKCLRANPRGFALFYKDQIRREQKPVNKLKCFIRLMQCRCYILMNFLGGK